MLMVFLVGRYLERQVSAANTVALYLLAGASGYVLSIACLPSLMSLGASGALAGIAAAVVVIYAVRREPGY